MDPKSEKKKFAWRTLHIQLLGDFRLLYGDQPVTTVDSPRLQSLLAYLLLHREAPQSRQRVAFVLWSDSTEAHARGSLRKLLHQLTSALPDAETFLQIDNQNLQWRLDAPFALDVAAFENAVGDGSNVAALRHAADLYRGDLLPSCYDDWIIPERERLRQTFSRGMERLTQLLENRREYSVAIVYAQRLLHHDPLHEETYRHLMRLYALSGDRSGALRAYHACATALARELEVEPTPATRKEYERLLNVDAESLAPQVLATPLSATAPMVGRDQEWERLLGIWRAAAAGQPQFVLLSGTAGIGKTRLAEEMVEWARRQGIETAWARAYAAEGELAYAPVVAWLRARSLPLLAPHWKREITRLMPELLMQEPSLPLPVPLSEAWQRQHLFEALARALLDGPQPLMLLLDDLQWCDRDTLEWLHYLWRFDSHARLLILGTMRSEEILGDHPLSTLVAALRRSRQITEIELAPLNSADTALLAGSIIGQPLSPTLVARLHRETEGNALFVVEMARAERTDPTADTTRLLPTVQAVIRARLASLSISAHELANVAATIGREFTLGVLQRASDRDEDRLLHDLDELWQRRIVREHGADAYDFSHYELREVAYSELSAARRRVLHRRVAQALEALHATELDTVSGQIAANYERAGLLESAVPYYLRAAKAAQKIYGNQDAIELYRRALTLIEQSPRAHKGPAVKIDLLEGLGGVLERIANYDEARGAYQNALKHVPHQNGFLTARLQRMLANTYKAQGRYAEALDVYALSESALDRAKSDADSGWWEEWINLQFDRFALQYGRADLDEMIRLAEKIKPIVEQHGNSFQRADLFSVFNRMSFRRDRYAISDEILARERAAFAAIEQMGEPNRLDARRFQLGFVLLWRGLLDEAEEQLLKALAWDEQIGEIYEKTLALTYLAILYRKRGQVDESRKYSLAAFESATAASMTTYIAMAKANLAWVAWKHAKFREAEAEAQAALDMWKTTSPFQWTALLPLIAVELKRDETARGVQHARALFESHQQRLPEILEMSFQKGLRLWEQRQKAKARNELERAVELSKQMGYL